MVSNGFTRKKVASLTLGEKLKRIRNEYRISLNEVAKNTKIQLRYLESLENGEYEKLPPDVYVRGFVRSYAHFLGADENVLLKLYERERNIQKNLKKEHFQESRNERFPLPKVVITPRILVSAVIVVTVLGSCFYLYREFQLFASVPYLAVLEPADGGIVEGSELYVRGKTDKESRLSINDQPTLVRDDGTFSERVNVQPGQNTLTVVAVNQFGKEERKVVTVQAHSGDLSGSRVENEESENALAVENVSVIRMELLVNEKATRVSVSADGSSVYNGSLAPGVAQSFEAKDGFVVTTEDGGRTRVRIDNGEWRSVGEAGKTAENISFGRNRESEAYQ